TGTLLDTPRLYISEQNGPLRRVFARGEEFLVIARESSDPLTYGYWRISAIDGSVQRFQPALVDPLPDLAASTGATWLMVTAVPGTSTSRAQVYASDFTPVGEPIPLPFSTSTMGLVPGEGQYLATQYGRAVRISEAGELLDPEPIVYSAYKKDLTRGAYHDGVYQLAWAGQGIGSSVWASRIDAQTGTPLDPDDTFNEISGAKLLRTHTSYATGDFSVTRIDGDIVVHWLLSNGDVQGVRVDPATGMRANGSVSAPPTMARLSSLSYDPPYELHGLGTSALLVEVSRRIRTGPAEATSRIVEFGGARPINVPSFSRIQPAAAFNGENYLVAFRYRSYQAEVISK